MSETNVMYENGRLAGPIMRGPYKHEGARNVMLALAADMASLTDLCHRLLSSQVPNGQYRYEPIIPCVFLVWSEMNTHSKHPQDKNMGWVRETSVTFWVLTRAMKPFREEEYIYSHLAWFVPYAFVGDSYSLLGEYSTFNSRETQAFFTPSEMDINNPTLSVDVMALSNFQPEAMVTRQNLLTIEPITAANSGDVFPMWGTWDEAVMGIYRELAYSNMGEKMRAGLDQSINPLAILSRSHQKVAYCQHYQIPQKWANVSKKDPTMQPHTSHLEVGEARMRFSAFRGGGLLANDYRVRLNSLESQPIADMLGLLGGEQPRCLASWWLDFDFIVDDVGPIHEIKPTEPKLGLSQRGRSFGFPVLRAPYYHRDGRVANFILDADQEALNKLCDDLLNCYAPPDRSYRPLPYVVMRYAFDELSSRNEEDAESGWLPETSISFWALVAIYDTTGPEDVFKGYAWFIPYIMFDNHYSVVSDREVYSLHESLASFKNTATQAGEALLTVETLALPTFSPETQAEWSPFLTIVGEPHTASKGDVESWTNDKQFIRKQGRLWAKLVKGKEEKQNIKAFFTAPQSLLFLREYTDLGNPNRPRSTCLTEAKILVTEFEDGSITENYPTITLNSLDSHPVARMLGLPEGEQTVLGGWWTGIDFALSTGRDVRDDVMAPPERIAVLGGGIGALTAVYELTNQPGWVQRYDITIYQEGWRLGGKLSSGRNKEMSDRVEEETILHAFFGFYDNTFRLIRGVYDSFRAEDVDNVPNWIQELDSDIPRLAQDFLFDTWRDAFHNQDFFVIMENDGDSWSPWQIHLPPNEKIPGEEYPQETLWDYFDHIIDLIDVNITSLLNGIEGYLSQNSPIITNILDFLKDVFGDLVPNLLDLKTLASLDELLDDVDAYAHNMSDDSGAHFDHQIEYLCNALKQVLGLMRRVERFIRQPDTGLRRLWLLMELGLVNLIGVLEDNVFRYGFDSINHLDYREWLSVHGANEKLLTCGPVRALYTIYEAFPYGVTEGKDAGNIAAGTAIHAILLLAFGYNGSAVWVPKTCMGEVLIAPMYHVLLARGVKFEFFHKVKAIYPSDDCKRIGKIIINQQATLTTSNYYPCRNVKGLFVWPNEPLYDQLEQAEELKARDINLESHWTDWKGVKDITLEEGKDFDTVLMNISLGALKTVGEPLLNRETNPNNWLRWLKMVQEVKTIQTQGAKFWFEPRIGSMGCPMAPVASGAYVDPLNSSLDMSYSASLEDWPNIYKPDAVLAFVGPLADELSVPAAPNPDYPKQQQERARATALAWAEQYIGLYCPYFLTPEGELNFDKLADVEKKEGIARFEVQYWAANINPTNRAVLSVKGSEPYRMRTDDTGFANLYVVGDWIDNGYLNIGCVEAAVAAGLQATRAITGYAPRVLKLLPR